MFNKVVPKCLALILLILIFTSTQGFAQSAQLGSTVFVAWRDGEDLFVAIGNDTGSRKNITILVENRDDRWRPTYDERQVTVPPDSLLIESFSSSVVRRGSNLILTAREGSRSVEIPIQVMNGYGNRNFIIEANSVWEGTLDLEFLLSNDNPRLLLDDFYTVIGSGSRGRIQVKTLEGGLKYSSSNNSIEFGKPYAVLSMRAPNINGISLMTFNTYKVTDAYRGQRERIAGPVIMVYGRNVRFIDNTNTSNRNSRPPLIKL